MRFLAFLFLSLLLFPSLVRAQHRDAGRGGRRHTAEQPWDFRDWANPEKLFEQLFGPESEREREILKGVTISSAEEREYGNRAAQALLDELRRKRTAVTRRGKDVDYLRTLAKRVQSQMQHADRYPSLTLYIAESEQADARCFPGGTLVVFRGLLDDAQSEAALIGVIGHELSHIDHGHQLQLLRRLKVAEQTFAGDDSFDPRRFLQNGTWLLRAFSRPFRPEDEVQADRDAVVWAFRLGYDPREFAEIFRRMGRAPPARGRDAAGVPAQPPRPFGPAAGRAGGVGGTATHGPRTGALHRPRKPASTHPARRAAIPRVKRVPRRSSRLRGAPLVALRTPPRPERI